MKKTYQGLEIRLRLEPHLVSESSAILSPAFSSPPSSCPLRHPNDGTNHRSGPFHAVVGVVYRCVVMFLTRVHYL